MDLSYGIEAEAYRAGVRTFLETNWTEPRQRGEMVSPRQVAAFRKAATQAGYLYRSIPKKWGGSEQKPDMIQAQVIREEFARAGAVMEVGGNGLNMLIPTLMEWGTPQQCDDFIPATIEGRFVWGQGYSEPGAGSDLASVRTRAELSGDTWVINGQKIWTSQGGRATHMFMLARSEPAAPKHAGLSYLLLDLDQPGVSRRPIRQITGDEGFYEFFFDNALTPSHWLVGPRGEGWKVSRTTLRHERSAIGSADGLGVQFDKLLDLARQVRRNGRPAIEDPMIRDTLARIEGWVMAHRYSSFRITSHALAGEEPGPIQLMMKLLLTEIGHDMALAAQELIGDEALLQPAPAGRRGRGVERWLDQIMGSMGNAIAGGTTHIQKNIIAERGLGLPRDMPGGTQS